MSLLGDLKEIDIISWLSSKGYKPEKESESKAWYCSPTRNENQPSFVVYKGENKYHDYGAGTQKGDIIDLVKAMENCSTKEAMTILSENLDTKRYEPVDVSKEPLLTVTKVLDKFISPELIVYLRSRGISEKTYSRFVKEAYYSFRETPDKTYYGVGLENDSGGWELRNSYHKYCTAPKDSTTYINGSNSCSVFEGMFDFLAAVEYFGESLFETDVYVLNGLGLLYKQLDKISRYNKVNIYLDVGIGANNSVDLIRSRMYEGVVYDHRYAFVGSKDFNEFWCNLNKK